MPIVSRRDFLKHSAFTATLAAAAANTAHGRTVDVDLRGSAAKDLQAGVARRDLTPDPGVPMWGYSNRADTAQETLDPLYGKTVVLRLGDECVAIVVTDCGRVPMPDSVARIREEVKQNGVADVIFSATHTHSGPIMEEASLPHVAHTEAAIIDMIREAASKTMPARIGVGRAHVDISHNRRLIKDGQCWMRWRNAERIPTAPIDHTAGLIRIDDLEGNPIATLVHYACHPVVFGPDSLAYSADWCGEMCRIISEETGGECLFLQGAAGDINPYLDKTPLADGAIEAMRGEGKAAADAILPRLASIETRVYDQPSIVYKERPVEVGLRYDLEDPSQVAILKQVYGQIFEKYMQGLSPDFSVPLGTLVLNGDLALALTPGELFIQHQIDFSHLSPLPNSFLCGYANDFHIYFPTVRDAAVGGYGGSTATYVGIGAGEKLVTESAIMAGESIGKFGKLTGPEEFQLLEL